MIPGLFPATYDFTSLSNGYGLMAETISCLATSEVNGGYELELKYPVTGLRYAEIANHAYIVAQRSKGEDYQVYRIYRISKPINGVITIYARHVVQMDLAGIPVLSFSADNVVDAMARINQAAVYPTYFTFSTTKTTVASMEVSKPTSILSLMGGMEGSILDTYGGEYEYNQFSVKLVDRLGTDNGVKIAYGKNLTSLEQEENVADCYSGAVGYWTDGETTVTTAVRPAPGTYDYYRIATVDLSERFETAPTTAQLNSALDSYMSRNKIGIPKVSLRLSFVDLSDTVEYAGIAQSVALGDTVHVSFPALGVTADARVVKTVWNVLLDRYESLEIGSVRASIADTVVSQEKKIEEQAQAINAKPNRDQVSNIAAIAAAAVMGAAGGAVRLIDTDNDGMPDTLYIADNPVTSLARKVWRFNYEGWAASENGYNGPFSLAATFGEIDIGGAGNKRGVIKMFNSEGLLRAEWNNEGMFMRSAPEAGYPYTNATWLTAKGPWVASYDSNGDIYNGLVMPDILDDEDNGPVPALKFARYVNNEYSPDVNASIRGDGLIECKRLVVNNREMPMIVSGSGVAYASNTSLIMFAQPFPGVPKVVASWSTTDPNVSGAWGPLKISEVSEEGFKVAAAGSLPTTLQPFDFIAVY